MLNFWNWTAPTRTNDGPNSGANGTDVATSEAAKDFKEVTQSKEGANTDFSLHSVVTDTYSVLWKLIIRPPRARYNMADLGPQRFRIGSTVFERKDRQLTNDRGLRMECSHFCPAGIASGGKRLPCVVYLHGNCSSRLEASDILQVLLPRNVTVFCLDFSGSGLSEGEYISLGHYEEQDLKVIVRHLRSLPYISSVGLWGRSMGAATSVLRASEDWALGAMVIDSPFSSLPVVVQELANSQSIKVPDFLLKKALQAVREEILTRAKFDIQELVPLRKAHNARSPVFFAVAEDDDFVLPHHTYDLHRVWGGNERKLRTFTGGHNGARPKSFLEEAANFLRDRLSAASQPLVLPSPSSRIPSLPQAPSMKRGESEDFSLLAVPPPPPEEAAPAESALARQLIDMGINQEMADEAARRNATHEAALDWVFRQPQDRSGIGTPAPPSAAGIQRQLLELGFPADAAQEAARRNSTVEGAVEWLAAQGQL